MRLQTWKLQYQSCSRALQVCRYSSISHDRVLSALLRCKTNLSIGSGAPLLKLTALGLDISPQLLCRLLLHVLQLSIEFKFPHLQTTQPLFLMQQQSLSLCESHALLRCLLHDEIGCCICAGSMESTEIYRSPSVQDMLQSLSHIQLSGSFIDAECCEPTWKPFCLASPLKVSTTRRKRVIENRA